MIGSVVVLYNPSEDEIKNINTYISSVDYAVIIDNSKKDNKDLIDSIISDRKKVQYYSEHKNLGLCKGLNIGIDILRNNSCEWAVLFDADSKLGSDIFSVYKEAINKFKNVKVAVFAPVHIFDRSKNKPYKGYKAVPWSMTSGWLINIEIFQKQQGFFEELFVDGLDMDYCFKSHENGYEVIECGEAIINHKPAMTKSVCGFKYGSASPYRYYMQARQLIWCWKRYHKPKVLLIYLYKWFKVVFLFPNKKGYLKEMIKGSKEGIVLWKIYSKVK